MTCKNCERMRKVIETAKLRTDNFLRGCLPFSGTGIMLDAIKHDLEDALSLPLSPVDSPAVQRLVDEVREERLLKEEAKYKNLIAENCELRGREKKLQAKLAEVKKFIDKKPHYSSCMYTIKCTCGLEAVKKMMEQ